MEEFQRRVQEYLKTRAQVVDDLDKLSKKSQPDEIQNYQTTLAQNLRQRRLNAKQGEFFTPAVAQHIRQAIQQEFQGKRLAALRKDIADAETKGVPVRVNFPYPAHKQLTEMPPALLLKLPPLPKELRYRFVGSNLLLMDQEALLVIDFMKNALP